MAPRIVDVLKAVRPSMSRSHWTFETGMAAAAWSFEMKVSHRAETGDVVQCDASHGDTPLRAPHRVPVRILPVRVQLARWTERMS